ncbi:hypothetical protein Alches_01770 [Alicyclobacillus hesperidum subsp. aegles]|nr:hypothetical protein Alches_01770 [Alicyclobacillus hesperidum subsp. aegles]
MERQLYNEDWIVSYQRSHMFCLPINPTCLFAYWFITDDWRRLCGEHWLCDWSNMPLTICVYDVTGVWFDGHNAPLIRQENIGDTSTTNWYIHNLVPGRHYIVDLAVDSQGELFSLLRSNMVSLPPRAEYGVQPSVTFAAPLSVSANHETATDLNGVNNQAVISGHPGLRYADQFDGYHLTR